MTGQTVRRVAVIGGAGFIGGHFVEKLLSRESVERVTVYDNFSSGRRWHLEAVAHDPRLNVIVGNVRDLDPLCEAVAGHDTMIHLASNPDIAAAMANPAIDFDEGTLLTHHVA
jgi:UDP-glucose 4-epimerase